MGGWLAGKASCEHRIWGGPSPWPASVAHSGSGQGANAALCPLSRTTACRRIPALRKAEPVGKGWDGEAETAKAAALPSEDEAGASLYLGLRQHARSCFSLDTAERSEH